jgi:hypothetical protein
MEQVINMSIEFEANIGKELSEQSIARLKACILALTPFKLGRESDTEFGLIKPSQDSNESSYELITVSILKGRVYVAFYASNGSDRDSFIKILEDAIAKEGIVADFEEL